jgi:secreted trypsin-like serine protease
MRAWLGLIVAVISSAAAAQPQCERPRNFYQSKIVGGSPAKIIDWPGLAALRSRDPTSPHSFYFCGATVITPTTVLTAAHCIVEGGVKKVDGVYNDPQGWRVEVVIGTDDLNTVGPKNVRGIREVTVHPQYRSASSSGNDVAVIQLDAPWDGAISRISPSAKADPGNDKMVMVAGFGAQKERGNAVSHTRADGEVFNAASDQLFEVGLPTISERLCKATYPGTAIGNGQICAGYREGEKDSCQGDSGGPMVAFDRNGCAYLVGVVSWGKGCAEKDAYGVYTRISAYKDWLRQQTRFVIKEMDEAEFDDGASVDLVKASFAQLDDLLGAARDRAKVTLNVGNQVKLHQAAIFNITSSVAGTLILLDINANGEVVQLFPNKFSKVRTVSANAAMIIPDNASYSLPAQEPVGKGRLVAIVAPPSFNAEALIADPQEINKGFEVKANPQSQSYLYNLIEQIRIALGAKGFTVSPTASLPDWAIGGADYEIIR